MTIKLELPPVPLHIRLGTIEPLSVVRDPTTNDRFLTTAEVEDGDWEDDESAGPGHPVKLVVISSYDNSLKVGAIVSRPADEMMLVEPAELRVNPADSTDMFNGLTRKEWDELAAGRKIHAIKQVRERTGLGLKEAKDMVDLAEGKGKIF